METWDSMLVVDGHGQIKTCSATLARLVGQHSGQLAGRPVWMLLPGWIPFGAANAHGSLRLLGRQMTIPVDISCDALHRPGETLFLVDIHCRELRDALAG